MEIQKSNLLVKYCLITKSSSHISSNDLSTNIKGLNDLLKAKRNDLQPNQDLKLSMQYLNTLYSTCINKSKTLHYAVQYFVLKKILCFIQ